MTRYVFLIMIVLSMTNLVAWAEPDYDYIRIARVSYMEGHVSFQHTSDVEWTAASINLPLQPGDRIYTGPQGRAEIEFDEGSVLRLAEQTDIQFLSLNEEIIQVRILTGLASLTVLSEANFEMDTSAAAFIVLRKGVYRFDTQDNGDTDAVVRKGLLEAVSHRFVHRIESGEQMFITADENSSYRLSLYDRRDGWDEWTDRRNADAIARASRKYLPDNVYVGVSDLDRNGRWVDIDSYGAAWIPYSVGASWSPYSVGRWCYRPVWGWTWVSYESWGWLPYHYGRWHRSASYGWCWLPGPSFSFNFWSPGLVTFYNGPSWVSWCPLGPGDYYSINNYYYNRRLHQHHVVSLRKLHRSTPGVSHNRNARGAFRTVEIAQFRDGGSRAVATKKGYRQIDRPWNKGSLVRERLAVQPTSRSYSADPDRRAVRSRVVQPKPALVHARPTVLSSKRDGYVRVLNADVTSPAERKAIRTGASRSGDNSNSINSSQSRNTVRSSPQTTSRQSNDVQSATPRNSTESDAGRSSRQQRITGSNSRSVTPNRSSSSSSSPSSQIRSTPPSSRSSARESVRTNRSSSSSNSSGVSRSTSSSSRSQSYSAPSSSSQSSSSSSSPSSQIRSTPRNSGSNAREINRTNRSSSSSGVSRSTSSGSQSRSYSAPSSSSRSSSSSASSSRSSSSQSSTSSKNSTSGNNSSSGSRRATRR